MMDKYITLLGTEEVRSAAARMESAAHEMSRAAAAMEGTLFRFQQFMDDWLMRLNASKEQD